VRRPVSGDADDQSSTLSTRSPAGPGGDELVPHLAGAEDRPEPGLGPSALNLREQGMAAGRRGVRLQLYKYAVLIALVIFIAVFSILAPSTFPTVGNLQTIINSQAELLILSMGLTLPLLAGDFDLSIGATMGYAGSLVAELNGPMHVGAAESIIITLAVCVLIGCVNAFLVVKVGINAFIGTLATSTVLAGLTLQVTKGSILTTVPAGLERFADWRMPTLGIGAPALVGFGLTLFFWYLYQFTPFGRRLFFVGEGREAARLTGLPVNPMRTVAFIGAAFVSGVAGLLLTGELGGMSSSIGPTYLLPAYAAAFLGATTIKPGRFNAIGTLVGLYVLVVGVTGLELLGVPSWIEQVFNGVALAVAVGFARFVSTEQVRR
jgi:ribose transport system permease protein